jgi:4-alpha-glucanotransferase
MALERASGILLHPTSLPARGGIGDLGPAAYEFIDFLDRARQRVWQVLPLQPPGFGNSPYSATSAFAGNPLLISLERLAAHEWIGRDELGSLPDPQGNIDFQQVTAAKLPLLRQAAAGFLARGRHRAEFEKFCARAAAWLEDYVLFEVLRRRHAQASWNTWPSELAQRDPATLEKLRRELAGELDVERALQFAFFEQWGALHAACARKGIRILGDVAIFVAYDSAAVWAHPEIFHLDEQGTPYIVAGVPPDAFSATGQRWGNPLYRWDILRQRGYDWWVERMRWTLETCDIVRLDHFRGFAQNWEIPASEPTAVKGNWVDGPGDDLFAALRRELGELPFLAEDLGLITPDVHALRRRLKIPGMKVLQFGFGDPGARMYLPHRYEKNDVVYTGTHDNDTTLGWWKSLPQHERRAAEVYLGRHRGPEMVWSMIRAAETSVADLCLIPMQDLLGLGSEARMNTPSRNDGNWGWRMNAGSLTPELAERMAAMVEVADRDAKASAADQQGHREVREHFAA